MQQLQFILNTKRTACDVDLFDCYISWFLAISRWQIGMHSVILGIVFLMLVFRRGRPIGFMVVGIPVIVILLVI